MKVLVEMLAFEGKGEFREAEVSAAEWERAVANGTEWNVLGKVYEQTQNDFNPSPMHCSTSVGDMIHIAGRHFLILGVGFREMSQGQFDEYAGLGQMARLIKAMVMEEEGQ